MIARIKSGRNLRSWVAWFLQERRRARHAMDTSAPELPALVHHATAGVPGVSLVDDVLLAENPGALSSDAVELWVLDPSVSTVLGDPPTEADWASAWSVSVSYDGGLGKWHYENAAVGLSKGDGDGVWIRGRFVRAGLSGPWSGAGLVTWSY